MFALHILFSVYKVILSAVMQNKSENNGDVSGVFLDTSRERFSQSLYFFIPSLSLPSPFFFFYNLGQSE